MKKLALVLAVLLIAAMSVTPVMASEFSASGQYRAEAISFDPGSGDKSKYFDQRFRLAFNWAVNDNVSAQLRGDFAEFRWGDGYRPDAGSDTLMIDRAFVKLNKGPVSLTVGQQGGMFGLGTLWGWQFQGIQAAIDLSPVTIHLLYSKASEGGVNTKIDGIDAKGLAHYLADNGLPSPSFSYEIDSFAYGQLAGVSSAINAALITSGAGDDVTDEDYSDDIDVYGISVVYNSDAFSAGLSYATMVDESFSNGVDLQALYEYDDFTGTYFLDNDIHEALGYQKDDTKSGFSLHFVVPFDMVTLSGEAVMFDGENKVADVDYAGTQFHLAADFAITEAFKAGLVFLWADDVDDDEIQLTSVQDDGNFIPLDFAGAMGFNNGNFGGNCSIFDVAGGGNGVLGIVANASFAATDALTLYAKLGYAEPNDDSDVNLQSNLYAIANFDYVVVPAATFSAGVGYVKPDYDDSDTDDDAAIDLVMQLTVSF